MAIDDYRRRELCCRLFVTHTADSLPNDVETLQTMLLAEQAARIAAEVKGRNAEAELRSRELFIEQQKFIIAKLRHEKFGQSAERHAVIEQLELGLADMEEDASEAEAAAARGPRQSTL